MTLGTVNGSTTYNFETAAATVPEPTFWAMMIVGVGLVGGAMRRRKGKITTTVAYA